MQSRYLVIDIGNTNIEIGIYTDRGFICSWRLGSNTSLTEDEYYAILRSLSGEHQIKLQDIEICCIASVVPELTRIFEHLFEKYLSSSLIKVTPYTPLGLTFPVDDPGFIGADLVVNAYAAWQKYGSNCLVCDFGTATTIQLVGADGHFYGTVIAPGVIISSTNLIQRASLLTKIQLETPQRTLGTNTRDALLSGIIKGHSYMVDSFIRQLKKEYAHLRELKVILTGGIAHLLKMNLEEETILDKTLTIDGLYRICLQHVKQVND
jgi:type III pantothenate kinase